jgi:N4-gp56 family major capsid protein|nr:MAG TPA: major capsid protein [Caudoviricetes sp.]
MKKKLFLINGTPEKLLTFFATGENTTTDINATTTDTLTPEMKTYYDKLLIKLTGPALVHDQFAQKRNIPKNGGKKIEFRKFDPLPKALTPLTEGVTPKGKKMSVTDITAEVSQYGDYILLSDVIQMTSIDPIVVEATEEIAEQAGKTLDTITREVINAGTNVQYAGGAAARSAITAANVLNVAEVMKAVTTLKGQNAKPVGDSFVAVLHPYVALDLMRDEEYKEIFKYTNAKPMYEGEIGKFSNVRFVESTEAKIWNLAGDGVSVFSTLVIGKNAYGTTEVEGGGLQHIVKPLGSSGAADPLDQRSTVGWKALKTAVLLVQQYMVRIESSASQYSKAAAN